MAPDTLVDEVRGAQRRKTGIGEVRARRAILTQAPLQRRAIEEMAVGERAWYLPTIGGVPPSIAAILADSKIRKTAHDAKTARRALRPLRSILPASSCCSWRCSGSSGGSEPMSMMHGSRSR